MKETNKIASSFKTKSFKGGMFTSLLVAVVIVFVVVINLVFSKLNINVDLTKNNLYSITDESKEFANGISDSIRIYYFAESGKATELIHKVIENYDGLGKDIKLIDVDPVLHPNYAESLLKGAGQVASDTVIVVNESKNRAKMVTAGEMIQTEYSYDYTNGSAIQNNYSDVEGQIDAALVYVTTDKLPKIYYTSGHGEAELSTVFVNLLTKNNFVLVPLDTFTATAIPADCDILFVNYAENDFTENDAAIVKSYIDKGGKVVLNTFEKNADHSNILSVINYMGLDLDGGLVVEGDSRYYYPQYPYYILPQISTHAITEGVKAVKRVIAPACCGLLVRDDIKESLTVEKLLSTSIDSYLKIDAKTNISKVEGVDKDGPFILGAFVSDKKTEAQLVIYSSSFIWDDTFIGSDTYGNPDLLVNSFKYLAKVESSFNVPAINLNDVPVLNVTGSVVRTNVILKLVVLPFACLAAGIIIFILRRRSK